MSNIIGVRNNSTIVPYQSVTKKTKQLTLTVTSAQTGWATTRAVGVFYADSAGVWRLQFNIEGSFTAATIATIYVTLSNVVFRAGVNQVVSCIVGDLVAGTQAYTTTSGQLNAAFPSTNTSNAYFAGDVELNAEPTTYTTAANMEGVQAVDVYIPPASATESGLVTTGAQTFAGVKTFSVGAKLDDAAGQDTLNYFASNLSAPGGDFTTGNIYWTRLGNVVTISTGVLTHASAQSPTSAAVIPADFRPTSQMAAMYYATGSAIRKVEINTNGTLTTVVYDWAGGALSVSDTGIGITISFIKY